jgi:sterol desaturase/sphingolipid hydroxylase (fatty acid hydroxylase superfamily)
VLASGLITPTRPALIGGTVDTLQTHEIAIRLTVFVGIFAVMAIWELLVPRRALTVSKAQRWRSNIGLVVLNSLMLRLLFPTAAIGVALFAEHRGWGVLNTLALPHWFELLIAVIVLDFAIWLQHVMVHAIPLLWRVHRMHHADLDYDLTTGARFHPFEIVLSMLIKFAVIAVLGPAVAAVLLFELILNGMAMFNHGNVRVPDPIDRVLRLLIVTPDMHRVHHSVEDDETNSNFGFNLSVWDRLCGTYRDQPRSGHEGMTIGIRGFRRASEVDELPGMLALPFRGAVVDYAINRRQSGRQNDEPV